MPVGLTPFDRVAVSVIEAPMSMALGLPVPEATVEIPGCALMTVSFSPVSLHLPATALLRLSPLYDAIQW